MRRILPLPALACLVAAPAAFAAESCDVSGPITSKEAMTKSLQDRGYAQIRGLSTHNGCYEAKGIDSKGDRFELKLHGGSGAIVNVV